MQQTYTIAIFISGAGSNAIQICNYFKNHSTIKVGLIVSNNEKSGAKDIAQQFNIPFFIFNKNEFYNTDMVIQKLLNFKIDTLILAGFLWLIPKKLIQQFSNKIINIHPALLPKYGGKGMYGINVHNAVFENKETESGITIHLCNEKYDDGEYLFQATCNISDCKNANEIAQKVLQLEHQYFAKVIEEVVSKSIDNEIDFY